MDNKDSKAMLDEATLDNISGGNVERFAYKCEICRTEFMTKRELDIHKREEHDIYTSNHGEM